MARLRFASLGAPLAAEVQFAGRFAFDALAVVQENEFGRNAVDGADAKIQDVFRKGVLALCRGFRRAAGGGLLLGLRLLGTLLAGFIKVRFACAAGEQQ